MVKGLSPDRGVRVFLNGSDLPLNADCRKGGFREHVTCLVMTVGGREEVIISLASDACEECGGRTDCRWHRNIEGIGGMKDLVDAANINFK